MSEREWLPERYFDEMIPELRASPTAWVVVNGPGRPTLATFEGDAGDALEDGAVVQFMYHLDMGTAVLTIADDLSWTVSHSMPADANGVWSPEAPDLGGSSSIDVFVKEMAELAELEPGSIALRYDYWSDPMPYRFDAATCSFVQVAS